VQHGRHKPKGKAYSHECVKGARGLTGLAEGGGGLRTRWAGVMGWAGLQSWFQNRFDFQI
jgi:hypothetical protein